MTFPVSEAEWVVFDREKKEWSSVTTDNWREAIKMAYDQDGLVPQLPYDVRPRTQDLEVASAEEFDKFMAKHF